MEKLFENTPEIISAAAKSPLGLFALMILALAVLGFFFFRRASEGTRVTVFVLMFVGVVAFGIAIFDASHPPSGESLVPNQEIEQLGDQKLAERQVQLEQKLREMEEALQREKNRGQQSERTQELPAQYANIGGTWYGGGGVSYLIQQFGTAVTIQEISPIYGVTAAGQGTITGRDISLSYRTVFGTMGSAQFKVSADGRQLTGTFTDLASGFSLSTTLYG
ncbi:MAG: hypothetical protein ONB46_26030 [candidate division KSB1 bacterium]|nr:hypothetical protein [candidate division KSB1 bacterium]MDZ7369400.1 hypothetical protein [candidate division KSB1 bacterium]MDZ7407536.1 hypothetical protein [candidate division KSB1 bacterium]